MKKRGGRVSGLCGTLLGLRSSLAGAEGGAGVLNLSQEGSESHNVDFSEMVNSSPPISC